MSNAEESIPVVTRLGDLVSLASELRDSATRSIIGIAGPPGVGKSTVAQALVNQLNAMPSDRDSTTLLPMDGYHLPNSVLDERGLRNVKGSPQTFDSEAYIELLRNIRNFPDRTWYAPSFDRVADEPVPNGYSISPSTRLVITEGNYLLLPGPWSEVKAICDTTWLLEIDMELERQRLIDRHVRENGRTIDDAIEFVDRSDLANARRINAESTAPDLVVRFLGNVV